MSLIIPIKTNIKSKYLAVTPRSTSASQSSTEQNLSKTIMQKSSAHLLNDNKKKNVIINMIFNGGLKGVGVELQMYLSKENPQ